MDVAYSSSSKKEGESNGDFNGFSIFRSISVADPMGLSSLGWDNENNKEEKPTTEEKPNNDPLDMRNIICHDSRENILDLNAIDSYYDKHT